MSLIDDELRGAVQAAEVCAARTTAVEKKRWGQFFSPPEVAVFMASLLKPAQGSPGSSIRVLDPGAGTGLLGLAAARSLLADGISRVHLVAVEPHPATRRLLQDTLLEATARHGDRLRVEILDLDFLDLAQPRLDTPTPPPFDVAIANPPYFKMSPDDPRGGTAPNIYARFMEIAARLPIPNRTYILLRRFSAKEEARRLTAAVLRADDLPGDEIGLENHLNFIHRPGGLVDIEEALGLAALLNSPLLDQYFRIVNGNTQVNATDLRALPLPPRDVITELGRKRQDRPTCPVDALMDEVLLVKNRPEQGDPGRAGDAPQAAKRERHLHPGRDGEHRPGYPMG